MSYRTASYRTASSRTAKFISAVFASLLAGGHLTVVSDNTARAADSCVAGPKGAPPQGGHWYYHLDHATNRHCWYLGDEKEKLSRAAPRDSSPSANPDSLQNEAAAQRSIADAHAELPLPRTSIEPQTNATAAPPIPSAASPGVENNQQAQARDADTPLSVVASRWPEPSDAISSAMPIPAASPGSVTQSNSEKAAPSVIAAIPLAAADSSSETQAGAIRILLMVIIGALALAGVMGATVFRFGSRRQVGRGERRTIWDLADNDGPPRAFREQRAADDPNRRIAEMLARLSRSEAA